jgi:hypothetical protein
MHHQAVAGDDLTATSSHPADVAANDLDVENACIRMTLISLMEATDLSTLDLHTSLYSGCQLL